MVQGRSRSASAADRAACVGICPAVCRAWPVTQPPPRMKRGPTLTPCTASHSARRRARCRRASARRSRTIPYPCPAATGRGAARASGERGWSAGGHRNRGSGNRGGQPGATCRQLRVLMAIVDGHAPGSFPRRSGGLQCDGAPPDERMYAHPCVAIHSQSETGRSRLARGYRRPSHHTGADDPPTSWSAFVSPAVRHLPRPPFPPPPPAGVPLLLSHRPPQRQPARTASRPRVPLSARATSQARLPLGRSVHHTSRPVRPSGAALPEGDKE